LGEPWSARLRTVQEELFIIGSHLAAPRGGTANVHLPVLDEEAVRRLEREIDDADGRLEALRSFILPGGSEAAARLHLSRCICRRAARLCVALSRGEPVPEGIVTYLNRLSDWLFTMARLANHEAGVPDVPWRGSSDAR